MEKKEKNEKYIVKIQQTKDASEKDTGKMDTLSPFFGFPATKKQKAEVGEKSHHDFLKMSQDNKYPLGKQIEKREYTKEEV